MGAVPLTVGTAGHIDHGKTALVRGADRLRDRPPGRGAPPRHLDRARLRSHSTSATRRLSLIDVPGHEKLVRTMIAGASGIDLFLLVVAADDGPMPQTREHLAVLRALGVEAGVIALTKVDLVDAEARLVAEAECEELLARHAARRGQLPQRRGPRGAAGRPRGRRGGSRARARGRRGEPLLHVDRCFTVAGRGTVVTGTLWSGTTRPRRGG